MSAIRDIDEALAPADVLAYETRVGKATFARVWAVYCGPDLTTPPAGLRVFEFWQDVRNEAIGLGLRTRLVSTLTCGADLMPVRWSLRDAHGSVGVEFHGDRFRAWLADGSSVDGSCEGADFLLADNVIPQLALKVRLLGPSQSYSGAFFSPNSLQTVPYELAPADGGLVSSFDERIVLDEEGWISKLRPPAPEVAIARIRRAVPRWDLARPARPRRAGGYRPPPPGRCRVADVEVSFDGASIGATWAFPAAEAPTAAALFVGGSGRHDRHGLGGGADLGYHELLDGLAARRVASLRYDKPGAGTTSVGRDVLEAGFDPVVATAEGMLAAVKAHPDVAGLPLFVIGHSEGGLVALDLATRHHALAGLVLLAVPARPVDEILAEQARLAGEQIGLSEASIEHQLDDIREFFLAVRNVADWTPETVSPRVYAGRHLRRWYAELLARDPPALVRRAGRPILVLQGDADRQVGVSDAELLEAAARDAGLPVERVVLAGLDHLFKRSTGEPGVRAHFDRRRRVSRQVVARAADWMDHLGAPPTWTGS